VQHYVIKPDRHDITEILLKVALNTIKQTKQTNTSHLQSLNIKKTHDSKTCVAGLNRFNGSPQFPYVQNVFLKIIYYYNILCFSINI